MSKASRLLVFPFLSLVASSCGESPVEIQRDLTAAMQTERLSYHLDRDGELLRVDIPYLYTNRTPEPVFVPNCKGQFSLVLEKQVADGWEVDWGPIVPDCESPPITIPPGESKSLVLRVWAAAPGADFAPSFRSDPISGTYRIRWQTGLSRYDDEVYPRGPLIPEEFRLSNPFMLRYQ